MVTPFCSSGGAFGGLLLGKLSSQSLGGLGVRPAMMSFSCCSSIVSYLMSASAISVQLVERCSRGFPCARSIVAGDDAAHFLVDGVRRAVRHLLVLRDAAAQEHFARSLRRT